MRRLFQYHKCLSLSLPNKNLTFSSHQTSNRTKVFTRTNIMLTILTKADQSPKTLKFFTLGDLDYV